MSLEPIITENIEQQTEQIEIKPAKKKIPIKVKTTIKKNTIPEGNPITLDNINDQAAIPIDENPVSNLVSDSDKKVKKVGKKKDDNEYDDKICTKVIDASYLKIPTNKEILQLEINSNDTKLDKELAKAIENAHNVLFNSDQNIQGLDALNDIMNLLFIKMLKPFLSDIKEDGKIDLLNKSHYCGKKEIIDGEEKVIPLFLRKGLLEETLTYLDLSKLLDKEPADVRDTTAKTDLIRNLGKVLKTHPLTKQIFPEETFLKMKNGSLIQSFLKMCIIDTGKASSNNTKSKKNKDEKTRTEIKKHIIDTKILEQIPDAIGSVYEYFISKYLKGSSMQGQFFTPRSQMKITLEYIKDIILARLEEVKTNKPTEKFKIGDFCMGTAGWLIIFYNMFKEQYANIIDVYGNDVNENTYQLGLMNLIITMGKLPNTENISCCSSLTCVNDTKLDMIATNPPFKTDMPFGNVKDLFESYQYKIGGKITIDEVYKLQSNSPPIQFTELAIYKLKENGLCLMVLPFGELFTGTGDNEKYRRYMLDTVNITDIITFPSGIYNHTGITTAIVIFINDKTGTKTIKFTQVYANSKKICDKMIEMFDIPKGDILKHPLASFNSGDYIKEAEVKYSSSIEIKTLGEVCEIEQGDNLVKNDFINGNYNVIGGGKIIGKHNSYNRDINLITLTRVGDIHVNFMKEKFYLTDNGFSIKIKNKCDTNIKYMYYYLYNNKNILEKSYKGLGQKVISKTNLKNIKIPIPPIPLQERVISIFDILVEKTQLINNEKISMLNEYNKICLEPYMRSGKYEEKTLGEVCEIIIGGTPSTKNNSYWDNGKNIWVSIKDLKDNIITTTLKQITDDGVKNSNVKLLKKDTLLFSFKLTIGKVAFAGCDLYTNEAIAGLIPKTNNLLNKYLYYYLKNSKFNKAKGLIGGGSYNSSSLKQIKISIPPLEKQKEIVSYCESNDIKIKELENEIEVNKAMAKSYLELILENDCKFNDDDDDMQSNSPDMDPNLDIDSEMDPDMNEGIPE